MHGALWACLDITQLRELTSTQLYGHRATLKPSPSARSCQRCWRFLLIISVLKPLQCLFTWHCGSMECKQLRRIINVHTRLDKCEQTTEINSGQWLTGLLNRASFEDSCKSLLFYIIYFLYAQIIRLQALLFTVCHWKTKTVGWNDQNCNGEHKSVWFVGGGMNARAKLFVLQCCQRMWPDSIVL